MSVQFIEPDFSKYPQHKKFEPPRRKNSSPLYDPLDAPPALSSSPAASETAVEEEHDTVEDNHDAKKSPYARRVSFDTIATTSKEAATPSSSSFMKASFISNYTSSNAKGKAYYSSYYLAARHHEYRLTYGSRTFMCSLTSKSYSNNALVWLMDTLLHDNDELVLLRLYQENAVDGADTSSTQKYQREAQRLLERATDMAHHRRLKINIQLELGVGRIKTVVHKMLTLHQPSLVIVGSSTKVTSNYRRTKYRKSISSYLIAKSPVPVIVVTPKTAVTAHSNDGAGVKCNNNPYFAPLVELTTKQDKSSLEEEEEGARLRPVNTGNTTATSVNYSENSSEDEDDDEEDDDDDLVEDEDDDDDDNAADYDDYAVDDKESEGSDPGTTEYKATTSDKKRRSSSIKTAWKSFMPRSPSFRKSWSFSKS